MNRLQLNVFSTLRVLIEGNHIHLTWRIHNKILMREGACFYLSVISRPGKSKYSLRGGFKIESELIYYMFN